MKIKLYKGDCLTLCAVEKAYDKAVKEASIAYKDGDKHLKATLERIFPELKESEDELSWLIRYIEEEVDSLSMDIRDDEDRIKLKNLKKSLAWLENQGEKDKLIKELGQYKVKYIQETLEKYVNSMSNKDDERLRKTTIAFLKDFAEQGYENAVECIDWLEKQGQEPRKVSIWKHWKDGICGNGEGKLIYLIKNGNNYSLSSNLGFECDYIELSELDNLMLEKQGEQLE